MNVPRQRKKIMELHTEYESMVKFFTFAVEKAETEEDKQKFQFQLSICKGMTTILELLGDLLEKQGGD